MARGLVFPPRKSLLPCCTAAFAILASTAAHAGAWLQQPGQKFLIYELSRYENTSQFDRHGHSKPQNRYDQWQNKRYYEFGLRKNLTFGTALYPQVVARPQTPTVVGLAEAEVFVRTALYKDKQFVISFQPLIKTPGTAFYATGQRFGPYHADLGASLLAGMNFRALGRIHFADMELGYRARFGRPKDQVRANATLGFNVTDKILIMPQVFNTWRARMPATFAYTQTSGDDYNAYKAGISAVYRINSLRAVQLGFVKDIKGKNTGEGQTLLAALWLSF